MITPRSGVSPAEIAAHPWTFRCEVPGCYYVVCADTEQQADLLQFTHGCPRKGSNMIGKSLLQQVWEQLDRDVREIMQLDGEPELLDRAKARARAKAEILALFMVPHFHTADEIAVEAGKRYAAELSGVYHLTPGMTR